MSTKPGDRITRRLDQAAKGCAAKGSKLTDILRSVMALIVTAGGPVCAYALLDKLKGERANAAPVTVYRALDFPMENGLIHKIERLNAFVACIESGDHEHHEHSVQFLICRTCGTVAEMGITILLPLSPRQWEKRDHATVEVEGTCGTCALAA